MANFWPLLSVLSLLSPTTFAAPLDDIANPAALVFMLQSTNQPKINVEIIGYRLLNGNCRGSSINDFMLLDDVKACAERCDDTDECRGFSHGRYADHEPAGCFLKSTACDDPVQSPFMFYEKISTTNVLAEEVASENESHVRRAFRKNQREAVARQAKQYSADISKDCEISNVGSIYAAMFMANRADKPVGYPLELYIQAVPDEGIDRVIFEVSAPSSSRMPPQRMVTQPGEVKKILVPTDFRVEKTGRYSKVLIVRVIQPANARLVVTGVNREAYTVDGFLALPVEALGTDYIVTTWAPNSQWSSEVGIAAIFDNTELLITLPHRRLDTSGLLHWEGINVEFDNGRVYHEGDKVRVTLDAFEALLIVNSGKVGDLSGTHISGNQPFSVFSGNVRTSVLLPGPGRNDPNRDHLVEQLPPTNTWGRRFVFASIPERTAGDYMKIVAAEDGTTVSVFLASGAVNQLVLSARQYSTTLIPSNECVYVIANNPIMMIAFGVSQSSEQSDPSMMIVPPIEHYKSDYTFSAIEYAAVDSNGLTDYDHYFIVVGKTGTMSSIVHNGHRIDVERVKSTATGEFSCGFVRLTQGAHMVELTTGDEFMGLLYGAGDRESYAYPVGMKLSNNCIGSEDQGVGEEVYTVSHGKSIDETVGTTAAAEPPATVTIPTTANSIINDQIGDLDFLDRPLTSQRPKNLSPCECASRPGPCPCRQRGVISTGVRAASVSQLECKNVLTLQICHGDRAVITCPSKSMVKIISAHFGRIGWANEFSCKSANTMDANAMPIKCGFEDVYNVVVNLCEGQAQCSFLATRYLLLSTTENSPCLACSQYLWVNFACLNAEEWDGALLASRESMLESRHWKASSSYSTASGLDVSTCSKASKYSSADCPGCSGLSTASTQTTAGPFSSRFAADSLESWCPSFCDRNQSFIELDLGGVFEVTGYFVQGRRSLDQWVTKLGFSHSTDGQYYTELRNLDGSWIEFPANSEPLGIQWCPIPDGLVARYVRAHVLGYATYPCLHLEFARKGKLLGCQPKTIVHTNMQNEPGVRGAEVTVTCSDGWMLQDGTRSYTLYCNNEGEWEGPAKMCQRTFECPDIPVVNGALHDGRNLKLGSSVSYRCLDGRRLIGSPTIYCQKDGTWTSTPQCA